MRNIRWSALAISLMLLQVLFVFSQTTIKSVDETRKAFKKLLDRPKLPLDVKQISKTTSGSYTYETVDFTSDKKADGSAERVPTYLVSPTEKKAKLPAVIMLHGTGGNKESQKSWLEEFAKRGWIGVAIDARHVRIVERLCRVPGLDANLGRLRGGDSALIWAARFGRTETVQALLAVPGIEVNARDKNGFSALMLAAKFGHINIIQALLAKPGIDVIDDENAILNIIKEKNLGDDIIELIIHEIWRAENPNIIGDPGGPGFQALKAKYNLDPSFKEANEKEKQKYVYIPSPEYIEKTKYIKKGGSRGRKYKRIKKSRKYKRTKKSKKSRRTRIRTKLMKAKPC